MRKIILKKVFSFFVLCLLVGGICKWWHFYTGGFKSSKIEPPQNSRAPVAEIPHLSEDDKKIFDQEFHFLDKGCQVYVFESLDKKYVIKFIRYHKYEPHFWMKLISCQKNGREIKEKYKQAKKLRLGQVYESYLASYEKLFPITKTPYVHLGTTDYLKKKLIVKDKWGVKYFFDLDRMHYVVQKKAKKFKPELLFLYKNDLNGAKGLIDQYFDLIKFRSLRSIRDFDHSGYFRNKGIIEGKIVDMDLGGYKKSDLAPNDIVKLEVAKFSLKVVKWAEKNTPLLAPYIKQKTASIVKEEK